MKVVWLSHAVPWPPKTGMLQRSYNLLREIARSHEVHLYALNNRALLPDRGQLDAALAALRKICSQVRAYPLAADRSPLHRAILLGRAFASRRPYDVHWLRCRRLATDLAALGRTERFDVVHVDTLGLWPYARAVGAVPTVLTHHNVESHMMDRRAQREVNSAKRLYLRNEARKLASFEKAMCPQADVNVVVSGLDAERLEAAAPGSCIRVVENGVDVDYFRPAPPTCPPSRGIVFVGGLNNYANREAALFLVREIWPALVKDDPQRTVTIVGQDPPRQLRDLASDRRVTVTGFAEDVRPYVHGAQIYVCPILDGGGTRLKVLVALAMAKPLVATRLSIEGLDLDEEVHYLRAETAADFLHQIRRLENHPELRERLARDGRRLVEERFSWAAIADKLNAAYLLARRSAPLSASSSAARVAG